MVVVVCCRSQTTSAYHCSSTDLQLKERRRGQCSLFCVSYRFIAFVIFFGDLKLIKMINILGLFLQTYIHSITSYYIYVFIFDIQVQLKFSAPPKPGNYQYSVILRSDSYFLDFDRIATIKVRCITFICSILLCYKIHPRFGPFLDEEKWFVCYNDPSP